MAKACDLVGRRFGKLVVIKRSENNHRGNTMWECRCDCGKTKIALGYDLTHGRTTSCGCNPCGKVSPSRQDLTGKTFNKLTVINLNKERSKKGVLYWNCRCECGNTTVVSGYNLKSGHTGSCGCDLGKHFKTHKYIRQPKNKIGQTFNGIEVIDKAGFDNKGKILWKCRCHCGREFIAKNRHISRILSCGCAKNSHFMRNSKLCYIGNYSFDKEIYRELRKEWSSMKRRCEPNYHSAKNYYDRGILVCDAWTNFDIFAIWALNHRYEIGLTLDRINNEKGYDPDNCRWVTMKVQQNNRRNNVNITYMGKTQTLKQWSEELNLNYGTIKARWQKGWKPPMLFDEIHRNQHK